MELGIFFLIAAVAIILGLFIDRSRVAGLVEECRSQIEVRGGQLLDYERRTLRSGPFMWAAKGQIILRVRWQDSGGEFQQLWVKRPGWPMGDKFVWDHDDGE